MRNRDYANWDLGQMHIGRSGKGVGTVQMSCRCTGSSMGEGVVLVGKEVREYYLAPWVTSPAAVEGSLQQTIPKLMALCTSLQRVKMLEEREGVAAKCFGDDAPIKGRTTVLASRVIDVPTGSGFIPTASTPAEVDVPSGSDVVPTASLVFATATVVTPVTRRKGKKVMVESKTPKK
nr:hypothetical protein [Tanacetum cinerariifolium]